MSSNLPLFIANRLAFSKKSSISSTIIRIAIMAIGISVAAMIIAVFMIRGFQVGIAEKIYGFWGHIDVSGMESTREISLTPLTNTDVWIKEIKNADYNQNLKNEVNNNADKIKITAIQKYIIFPSIMISKYGYEGIVTKGVGNDFNSSYIIKNLKKGKLPKFGNGDINDAILISQYTADRLKTDVDKYLILNFFNGSDQIKKRVRVSGIYSTGLAEYDKKIAFVDIRLLQMVLGWSIDQVGGLELYINDVKYIDQVNKQIYNDILPTDVYSSTIIQKFPSIFEWLKLQSINENVILLLMLIVSVINMITALLILILERTNMIGILEALGCKVSSIRKIFLIHASYIVIFGLIIGNILGIGFSILQKKYQFIKLNEANYYLSYAPIQFDLKMLIILNVGTLLITIMILIIPSYIVSKIDPIKTISFR